MKSGRLWVAWIVLLFFVIVVAVFSGLTGNYFLYDMPFFSWLLLLSFCILSLLSVLHVKKQWALWAFSIIFFVFALSVMNQGISLLPADLDALFGF